MFSRAVFVFLCVFVGQHKCFQPDKNFNKLYDAEWRCDSVCVGSGGIAEFDVKNKICKCTFDKNMDDVDKKLIIKNAQAVGVKLKVDEKFNNGVVKREVDTSIQQAENIVGQQLPNRMVTPRSRPSMNFPSTTRWSTPRYTTYRPITPIHRITTPRRNQNVQQRIQQIQHRINELRRSRTRSGMGPHLQQRAGFENDPQANIMERLKEMQRERLQQLINKPATPTTAAPNVAAAPPKAGSGSPQPSPVVGASHNAGGVTNKISTKDETGVVEKNYHFELITQDPSLYKDDN